MKHQIIVPDLITLGEDKKPLYKGIKPIYIDDAVNRGINLINEERQGKQLGLYTRWEMLNILHGKYFRFGEVNLFSSLSSHGKSLMLNMLKQDFSEIEDIVNRDGIVVKLALNRGFEEPIVILYFGFEQDVINEIVRTLSGITGMSSTKLKSSDYDAVKKEYVNLSDGEFEFVKSQSKIMETRPIYYFSDRGTPTAIYNTVLAFEQCNPGVKIVVFLDHSFLAVKEGQVKSDGDLIQSIGNLAITLKKRKVMVNILHQMNNNIKDILRITKVDLHYPIDSDIYYGSQIFWACDNVYIFPYQPVKLNIKSYSPAKLKTSIWNDDKKVFHNLVVCSKIKARDGITGERYFKSDFGNGRLIPASIEDFTTPELTTEINM